MKTKYISLSLAALLFVTVSACKKETRDKLNTMKNTVSNASTVVGTAKEVREEADKLKELTPLSNEALKSWLPEDINGLKRTEFKVGKTGYMNVASIEGRFKNDEGKEFRVEIMDGAGEMGSSLVMGMSITTRMNMEEETESKHVKSVTRNGVDALQTYHKKRDDTTLQFVYDDRFMVIVHTRDMGVDETWEFVDDIDLEDLMD